MPFSNKAKLIALYFPQLHPIAENDEWWGKGFTDWDNVKSAQAYFKGHNQPRVPLNNNYYDQSQLDTLHSQIDLAKANGVYGFCHYHYWFDGKQLLETPTNMMLQDKSLDFPFCLSWANETWSRRWDGSDQLILIKQTHPPLRQRWKLHFDYLIKAWTDERAIKVDGKPVFIIYRPLKIPEIDQMLDYWRELAHAYGLQGLYFIHQKQSELASKKCLKSFDAMFQFQPFESIYSPALHQARNKPQLSHRPLGASPEFIKVMLRPVYHGFKKIQHIVKEVVGEKPQTFYHYDEIWQIAAQIHQDSELTTFPGAFVDWDNTARYKNRAKVFLGASPARFEYWFDKLVASMPARNLPENFIFLNAWNEWAEGAYLEPDEKYGHAYLDAVKKVLS